MFQISGIIVDKSGRDYSGNMEIAHGLKTERYHLRQFWVEPSVFLIASFWARPWVYRHKRIESHIGIEHVFCLVACVERLLNPGCFLTLSNNRLKIHNIMYLQKFLYNFRSLYPKFSRWRLIPGDPGRCFHAPVPQ